MVFQRTLTPAELSVSDRPNIDRRMRLNSSKGMPAPPVGLIWTSDFRLALPPVASTEDCLRSTTPPIGVYST